MSRDIASALVVGFIIGSLISILLILHDIQHLLEQAVR
jgi:hypothetical protein